MLAARGVFLYGKRGSDKEKKKKKSASEARGLGAASGRTFCQDNMLAYMASCQTALRGDKHGYVGMDGTAVSNKDLVFYVFEGWPSRRSCWMVPKVAWLFTHFRVAENK